MGRRKERGRALGLESAPLIIPPPPHLDPSRSPPSAATSTDETVIAPECWSEIVLALVQLRARCPLPDRPSRDPDRAPALPSPFARVSLIGPSVVHMVGGREVVVLVVVWSEVVYAEVASPWFCTEAESAATRFSPPALIGKRLGSRRECVLMRGCSWAR